MRIGTIAVLLALLLLASSAPCLADDPYNYATVWKEWSDQSRRAYLWGARDGGGQVYLAAAFEWLSKGEFGRVPESARVSRVRKKTMLVFEESALIPVITDLYRDPANAFVPLMDMTLIARDKLQGSAFEDSLRQARKKAVQTQEYIESQKK
jgi:hypothetical protein